MEIKNTNEHGLIESIKNKIQLPSREIIAGPGDDAAVLKYDKKRYLLFTTDMLAEDIHFSLKYFSPEQVGMKAIEQNVSDVAAMGGAPKYAVVSLALPKADIEFVDRLYIGILKKSRKYGIRIVGGNISRACGIAVNIAMIGFVEKKYLALRSTARTGDLIFCSGDAGGSAAGLELLKENLKGKSIKKHLEPQSRIDLAGKLAKIGITSMIDLSDGIASEIRHICAESRVGARIYAGKIPISKSTIDDAKKTKKKALDFALYGGEDFELIFTANKNKMSELKKYDVHVIGEIVDKKYGVKLIKNNKIIDLKNGFEHFK